MQDAISLQWCVRN